MKLAIEIGRTEPDKLALTTEWVQHAERLGVYAAYAGEAWWSDAVTPLAYLADKTSTIKLGTGIMQVTARTPAMTAMTALTMHDLTGGRFILGLGASGPQGGAQGRAVQPRLELRGGKLRRLARCAGELRHPDALRRRLLLL